MDNFDNLTKEDIVNAIEYIEQHGIPKRNASRKYNVVLENGKVYPPKYVIAVARHLATGVEIDTSTYWPQETFPVFEKYGFVVEKFAE
jgi:hypothetical protein